MPAFTDCVATAHEVTARSSSPLVVALNSPGALTSRHSMRVAAQHAPYPYCGNGGAVLVGVRQITALPVARFWAAGRGPAWVEAGMTPSE
jgi:hypothetical protein